MARKEPFLKGGVLYYKDPSEATPAEKQSWLSKIIYKILTKAGVPVYDPCCPTGDRVVVVYNKLTGTQQIFNNGVWVDVETAGGSATTTTVAPTTTTTTVAP